MQRKPYFVPTDVIEDQRYDEDGPIRSFQVRTTDTQEHSCYVKSVPIHKWTPDDGEPQEYGIYARTAFGPKPGILVAALPTIQAALELSGLLNHLLYATPETSVYSRNGCLPDCFAVPNWSSTSLTMIFDTESPRPLEFRAIRLDKMTQDDCMKIADLLTYALKTDPWEYSREYVVQAEPIKVTAMNPVAALEAAKAQIRDGKLFLKIDLKDGTMHTKIGHSI